MASTVPRVSLKGSQFPTRRSVPNLRRLVIAARRHESAAGLIPYLGERQRVTPQGFSHLGQSGSAAVKCSDQQHLAKPMRRPRQKFSEPASGAI
ncbi:MAG: hypothetical protein NVSMB62_16820 [Acidobacteriaceae bacterium]